MLVEIVDKCSSSYDRFYKGILGLKIFNICLYSYFYLNCIYKLYLIYIILFLKSWAANQNLQKKR